MSDLLNIYGILSACHLSEKKEAVTMLECGD